MELAHVDAVIRMFRPNYDIDKIATKRSFGKNPAGLPKGTGSRHAMSVLREAGVPLTANDIAGRVLVKLQREDTPEARKMLACTIVSTFSRRKDGAVKYDAATVPGLWSIAGSRGDGVVASRPMPVRRETILGRLALRETDGL
jgi:hypothetical protein